MFTHFDYGRRDIKNLDVAVQIMVAYVYFKTLVCMNAMSILWWQEGGDVLLNKANCRAKGGAPGFKVAILGAAGGIGQPLALLMKINPLVSVLHLYDVVNTPGVTADVSHMDTGAVVISFFISVSILFHLT